MRILLPWYKYPPFRASGIGGLSVVVWELTHQLAQTGVDIEILTPESIERKEADTIDGIRVLSTTIGTKLLRNHALTDQEEAQLLRDYDAIFSVNNYGAGSLHYSSRLKSRVVRQVHTIAHDRALTSYLSLKPSLSEYLRIDYLRHLERVAERRLKGTRTLCVSRFVLDQMIHHNLESTERLFQIPNGVDTAKFRPLNRGAGQDLLFVGRFQKVKGLDLLVKALQILRKEGRKYNLRVAGEFSPRERQYVLEAYGEGLEDSIQFLGTISREALPEILNSARLLVIPSRYESFPLTALEGLACGVPMIASRTGGLPEIVEDGVGRLFENGNVEELAGAIQESYDDDALHATAVSEGPARAMQYDWKEITRKIFSLLEA